MTAQPMDPKDVPGKILAEALEAWTGYDDPLNECAADDIETAATILAAVIPLIRAQVAGEIEAAVPEVTVLTSTQVIYQANGMQHAARIARGGQ